MFSELTNNFQYKNLFEEPSTNYVIIVNIEPTFRNFLELAGICMTEIHFPDAESGGIVDQVQNPSRKFYLIVSKDYTIDMLWRHSSIGFCLY